LIRIDCYGVQKLFVKFQDVSCRADSYYQCVFLLCADTKDLSECRRKALACLSLDTESNYTPHLSLLYSDMSYGDRKAVAEEVVDRFYKGREGCVDGLLHETGFWANEIEIWEVDPEDKTLESWKLEATIPFSEDPPLSNDLT